jgi:hypothetical protein
VDTEIAVVDSETGSTWTPVSPPCGQQDRRCGQPYRRHVDSEIAAVDGWIAARTPSSAVTTVRVT